jgi:tyrosyl-tRNA synthetase
MQTEQGANPRDIKVMLAKEIVARFHNAESANNAQREFEQQFSKGMIPEDIECKSVTSLSLIHLLKEAGLTKSTSESLRMIKQGAVKIDGERVEMPDHTIQPGSEFVIQLGKRRFIKIIAPKDANK